MVKGFPDTILPGKNPLLGPGGTDESSDGDHRLVGSVGAILICSSSAPRLGSPGEYFVYAATKVAIDTFTVGLAKEVAGDGIRVNAVRPGFVHTDIHASAGEPGRVDRLKGTI